MVAAGGLGLDLAVSPADPAGDLHQPVAVHAHAPRMGRLHLGGDGLSAAAAAARRRAAARALAALPFRKRAGAEQESQGYRKMELVIMESILQCITSIGENG